MDGKMRVDPVYWFLQITTNQEPTMKIIKDLALIAILAVATTATADHAEGRFNDAKEAAVAAATHETILEELRDHLATSVHLETTALFAAADDSKALDDNKALDDAMRKVDELDAAVAAVETDYEQTRVDAQSEYVTVQADLQHLTEAIAQTEVAQPAAAKIAQPKPVSTIANVADTKRVAAAQADVDAAQIRFNQTQANLTELVKAASAVGDAKQRGALIKALKTTKRDRDKLADNLQAAKNKLSRTKRPTAVSIAAAPMPSTSPQNLAIDSTPESSDSSRRPSIGSMVQSIFGAVKRPLSGFGKNKYDIDFQAPEGLSPDAVVSRFKIRRSGAQVAAKQAKKTLALSKRSRTKAKRDLAKQQRALDKANKQAQRSTNQKHTITEFSQHVVTIDERHEWIEMLRDAQREVRQVEKIVAVAAARTNKARQIHFNWDRKTQADTFALERARKGYDQARAMYAAARKWRNAQTAGLTSRRTDGAM